MPAKAKTLEKVAKKLGLIKVRHKGSHADDHATIIPIHDNGEIDRISYRLTYMVLQPIHLKAIQPIGTED